MPQMSQYWGNLSPTRNKVELVGNFLIQVEHMHPKTQQMGSKGYRQQEFKAIIPK